MWPRLMNYTRITEDAGIVVLSVGEDGCDAMRCTLICTVLAWGAHKPDI
jgi:hypothetical protein